MTATNPRRRLRGASLEVTRADCADCRRESDCWPESAGVGTPTLVERLPVLPRGQSLWEPGATGRALFLVNHGCIKVSSIDRQGDEQVLQFALPGDLIGLEDYSSPHHQTQAIALLDSQLCRLASTQPAAGGLQRERRLLARASSLLRQRALRRPRSSPRHAVQEFIGQLADRIGHATADGRIALRLPMTRRELGQYLGHAEETIVRTLRAMQREGLMQVHGKLLQLNSRDFRPPGV